MEGLSDIESMWPFRMTYSALAGNFDACQGIRVGFYIRHPFGEIVLEPIISDFAVYGFRVR